MITEEPVPVECWQCGRIILSATGFISCTCGCTQASCNATGAWSPSFDPDFAANSPSPA